MFAQPKHSLKKFKTQGIILNRTNFGEADRIITFITPDHGKVKAIAKGVRKSKSKMAGGMELFSVSQLSFLIGKKDINTLISTRLIKHWGNIVKDIHRTNAAYESMRLVNKTTEDEPEEVYFGLLQKTLEALDDFEIPLNLTMIWLNIQLIKLAGHAPNLRTDIKGRKLLVSAKYNFDIDRMGFFNASRGKFNSSNIMFLRLGFSNNSPKGLSRINDLAGLVNDTQPLVQAMLQTHVRV